MQENDSKTFKVLRGKSGGRIKSWENGWLLHMGFTEEELGAKEIWLKGHAGENKKMIFEKAEKPAEKETPPAA